MLALSNPVLPPCRNARRDRPGITGRERMHIALDLHESLGHQDQRPQGFRTAEPPPLTPTQMKVLRCVHSGLLNKQIAYELGMAEATVKVHMTALMRKLNVR